MLFFANTGSKHSALLINIYHNYNNSQDGFASCLIHIWFMFGSYQQTT